MTRKYFTVGLTPRQAAQSFVIKWEAYRRYSQFRALFVELERGAMLNVVQKYVEANDARKISFPPRSGKLFKRKAKQEQIFLERRAFELNKVLAAAAAAFNDGAMSDALQQSPPPSIRAQLPSPSGVPPEAHMPLALRRRLGTFLRLTSLALPRYVVLRRARRPRIPTNF